MEPSPGSEETARRWQTEADLLADGRDLLERLCGQARYRHLYPEGPNLALLLQAYQDLDRLRTLGRVRGGARRQFRALRRLLREHVRRDVLDRHRRLSYHYPQPRRTLLPPPPDIVRDALQQVDADARPRIAAELGVGPPVDLASDAATQRERYARGHLQFRDALIRAALTHPDAIVTLHPQYLEAITPALPRRRGHPVANMLLVRIPLQFLLLVITLFNVAYLGAYLFFNDETLGRFVSGRVNTLIQGDLEMGSIHWEGRLIFDLLTGTPTSTVVEDVTVWEPYKSYGHERLRRAAHAERVEASLVLHEIIPWNRLGVPTVFEIPWVLHFPKVRIEQPVWFAIREYEEPVGPEGEPIRVLGLRDAFRPAKALDPDRQGLSFAVDDAELAHTVVDIDYTQTGNWRTAVTLDQAELGLQFDAPDPHTATPIELPLAFTVKGSGSDGVLQLGTLDVEVPLGDIVIEHFTSGTARTPFGDVSFGARAVAAGSPVHAEGGLRDVFPRQFDDAPQAPRTVVLDASSVDVEQLAEHIVAELDLPPQTVDAKGARATARIEGLLEDPTYTVVVQGLTLDILDEPAWLAEDVAVALTATHREIPDRWRDRFDADARKMVVTFDTLMGRTMNGNFRLHPTAEPAQVVMPEEGEPYLISAELDIAGIDPGRLVPESPDTAKILQGSVQGSIDIHKLVIGPPPTGPPRAPVARADDERMALLLAELELSNLRLRRTKGPQQDGMPREIRLDGGIRIDEHGNIDLDDTLLATDGARLHVDGGIEGDLERLRSTLLDLRIDDGQAFARAMDMPAYFDRLQARMNIFGPLAAPSGTDGSVRLAGGVGDSALSSEAKMWMDDGVLHLRAPQAEILGGHGRIELDVALFEHGGLAKDPKLRAYLALQNVDLGALAGDPFAGRIDLEVEVGDGSGKPMRLSEVRVHGLATADTLTFAGTTYRDAAVSFRLTAEELAIDQLVLPVHWPVSPAHAPGAVLEIGRIVGSGTISRDDDPKLDLALEARGIPLAIVRGALGLDLPVRGRIDRGTELQVAGTVSRPKVEGTLALVGLSAANIQLGSGRLEVTSEDFEASGPLAAHREVRITGELATTRRAAVSDVQWTLDAVFAIGQSPEKGSDDPKGPPIAAQLDVSFDKLSLPTLLRDPAAPAEEPRVDGRLEGLSAHLLTCPPGRPMLTDCVAQSDAGQGDRTLSIDLHVDSAWMRSTDHASRTSDPCEDPATLCSGNALQASIDWPLVRLEQPWTLATGGDAPATIRVEGSFDLAEVARSGAVERAAATMCRPPAMVPDDQAPTARSEGSADAQLTGTLDFGSLAPLLEPYGIKGARGKVDVDIGVAGKLRAPQISGSVVLAPGVDALVLEHEAVAFPIEFTELRLQVIEGWLAAAGNIRILGAGVRFGSVHGEHTGYALTGPCTGQFDLAAEGMLGSRLLAEFLGDNVAGGNGGIDIKRLYAAGHVGDTVELRALEGTLGFEEHALQLEFTEGITTLELDRGHADIRWCDKGSCPGVEDGFIAVHLGGAAAADAERRPPQALGGRVGTRGEIHAWGALFLDPSLQRADNTSVRLQLDDVPVRGFDPRGRPVYEGEISSSDLAIRGGAPLVVSGRVEVDRGRYIKDAVQGVEILAFTDSVEAATAPPPELLQGLQFEMHLETTRPFRVENNIASGVEANAVVQMTGTYEHPEFSGRFEVEPGGKVDIPFLTGSYEIERGRVTLRREFADAEVDVVAERNEPIFIEGQPRQVQLLLGGTLSEIRPSCMVEGDTSGSLTTLRGCTEYLVLGAGDVQVTESDVQRSGSGGLANARKSLQVVGHLTEVDVGDRAAEAVPRFRGYIPDTRLRLGQIGPELEIATPPAWMDFNYGQATVGWDYTRGYPGFLLRQSRDLSLRVEILDPITLEFSRQIRSYLNERIVFDPLKQRKLELRFDFQIPSLR